MIDENVFNILVTKEKLWDLYRRVGFSIKSKTDFTNYKDNTAAFDNALAFMLESGFIVYAKNKYEKKVIFNTQKLFNKAIIDTLFNTNFVNLVKVFDCEVLYDSFLNKFYANRNSLKLKYSGLIMLLNNLDIISIDSTKIYFSNNKLLELMTAANSKRKNSKKLSQSSLEELLKKEKELGEDAENKALSFERKRISGFGKDLEPVHVSIFDCEAGFDIASYENKTSTTPDRFIEVKNVDSSLKFYISKNEIDTSKLYSEKYYLYLYNREKNSFLIIKNPFKNIFNNNQWNKIGKLFECSKNF